MAAQINLKVKSDFAAASDDLKRFGTVTETERKKIEKFAAGFKDENIKQFNDRLRRSTAAIKATRGPTAAMISEHKKLQRQIETLIRRGLDPESKEVKQLAGQYKKLEKEIDDVTKKQLKQQKSMKRTEGAMLALGAGAVMMGKQAVDAFIDISKESARLASDAEEIEGKYNVVFRDIQKEASAAAQIIADDFDLAASTVNKLLGDTGDILTGLGFDQKTALEMSKSVGTLALDLASFTNFAGGAEGASAALTKALLGEAESAKALGIVIRQDTAEYKALVASIMEVEKVGLVQAKALAAMRIATEQSKNAIGDYARTSGSAANVQKTLNEQIKRSKELWGESLNEGLTPLRKAYRDWLKELNDSKQQQSNIEKAYSGEIKTTTSIIEDQKRIVNELAADFAKIGGDAVGDFGSIQEILTAEQIILQTLENNLKVQAQINLEKEKERTISEGARKQSELAAAEEERRNNLSIEAFAELEKRRVAGLTAEEKQLELLNQSIDKWAEYKELAGVQELINSLVAERTKLLEEGLEVEAGVLSEGKTLWTTDRAERLQANIDYAERVAEITQEQANREIEEQRRVAAEHKATRDQMIMDIQMYGNATMSVFSSIGQIAANANAAELQRMEDEGASQEALDAKRKELAKKQAIYQKTLALAGIAVNAPSAIVKAFADGGPIMAAIVGAAVGVQAIAAATAPIPEFAEGGSFTTNGPMPIMVGDNIGGQERVTVEPVSSTGMNVENSNSSNMGGGRFRLVLDNGSELFGSIQQEFDNGGLTVPERNVRAS